MAQSADGLRKNTPNHHHTITQSTALARLTEAINQGKFLTRRSTVQDALWDITESMLRTLRNKFNSRLWMLRALWYAEPFRLVTVGRWLSRINRETIDELNALDDHVWTRITNIECSLAWTMGDENENICPQRNGPHMVDEQMPYRCSKTMHQRNVCGNTAPNDCYNMLIPHDKYHDNTMN